MSYSESKEFSSYLPVKFAKCYKVAYFLKKYKLHG